MNPAYNPTNITFLPDGGFNVGDGYGSNYLINYDKDGRIVKVFGGTGEKPGQLRTPHGQWVDARDPKAPVLVVCDRANARLQWFELDGTHLLASKPRTKWSVPGPRQDPGRRPARPGPARRVSLFDRKNQPIVHLGEDPAWRERWLPA